jgi:hypothetical protein
MAVIDLTVFALAGDEAAFLRADKRMQVEFVYQQPGCQRRTVARADGGDWLVLTWWSDVAAADAAAQAAETHPAAQEFWAHVKSDTVRTRRFTPLDG